MMIVCLLLCLFLILSFLVYASYSIQSGIYLRSFCKKRTTEKVVALTFDDGPDPIQTPKVLKVLKEYQATACFFCIGHKIKGNEALLKSMVTEGHLIGNHSYSHSGLFPLYGLSKMKKDLQTCQCELERVTSQPVTLFRPPFGVTNPTIAKAVRQLGYTSIGWSIRTLDLACSSAFGLDALVLFKKKKMAIFFLFSMLLGAALQITNTYGDLFLSSFASIPEYAESFGVKHSVILLSISQMSETLFILAIPFFLRHFGIKQVMLISMFAWVFRFGLFGFGDPGSGLWMLILSMIVYGMAFDFFNISGSLFVEQEANSSIRASAQGLFFMMTNGLGAIIGGYASGAVVDAFSVYADGRLVSREWMDIWLIFAAYALVIGILFALVFKYKHQQESKTN